MRIAILAISFLFRPQKNAAERAPYRRARRVTVNVLQAEDSTVDVLGEESG
jgi:hypothetical protein